jgi:hypothetical protein
MIRLFRKRWVSVSTLLSKVSLGDTIKTLMRWLSYVNSGQGMDPVMSTSIGAVGSTLMGGMGPLLRLTIVYRTQRVNGLLIRGMNSGGHDDAPALDWRDGCGLLTIWASGDGVSPMRQDRLSKP